MQKNKILKINLFFCILKLYLPLPWELPQLTDKFVSRKYACMKEMNDWAICCMSGGYKNVFAQGVLKAFEDNGVRAKAYAACSSSALIAAYAAFNKVGALNLSLWSDGYAVSQAEGNQSGAMLQSIERLSAVIKEHLWEPQASRLLIATSRVTTEEAVSAVQSDGAKRLGQMLLINALRHKPDWKDKNLELQMFDTRPDSHTQLLTKANFDEVAYATTRMLHAWKIPATIDGNAYVDGSYTSLCPVVPLVELGYRKIVCICNEKEKVTFDLFSEEEIPARINDATIRFIKPDYELKDLGVGHYTITDNGLEDVYNHGLAKGAEYLRSEQSTFPG